MNNAANIDGLVVAAEQAEHAYDVAFESGDLNAIEQTKAAWQAAQAAVDAAWEAQRAAEQAA